MKNILFIILPFFSQFSFAQTDIINNKFILIHNGQLENDYNLSIYLTYKDGHKDTVGTGYNNLKLYTDSVGYVEKVFDSNVAGIEFYIIYSNWMHLRRPRILDKIFGERGNCMIEYHVPVNPKLLKMDYLVLYLTDLPKRKQNHTVKCSKRYYYDWDTPYALYRHTRHTRNKDTPPKWVFSLCAECPIVPCVPRSALGEKK